MPDPENVRVDFKAIAAKLATAHNRAAGELYLLRLEVAKTREAHVLEIGRMAGRLDEIESVIAQAVEDRDWSLLEPVADMRLCYGCGGDKPFGASGCVRCGAQSDRDNEAAESAALERGPV